MRNIERKDYMNTLIELRDKNLINNINYNYGFI
jgi:hypothetical protein